ncbi:hypothetical protein K450DRAFT_223384 [Umbelopsis ramanniana AG]|uniref:tRNA-binding domain-containing protein n=1 Tax=Umbelopsis ramanniana AG TaxID=1314678 RepID=A0AAD5EH62_UMBRA|nr:uncharacterized protein K450DRAFT_223384 [Umbelopsis ramanniana AG]KAI8583387.1 hypothetical protein K450DRAFT_223384 [Umbelopsis ramanniana AG]
MLSTYRVSRTIPQRLNWQAAFFSKAKYSTKDASEQPLIHRLNVQIGKIVQVERHPEAEHLYVEKVDLGEVTEENTPVTRTIVSGLVKYMGINDMLNKQVLVVGNMKPSKFRGILSQGMLLAASKGDMVELLEPASGSVVGERVQVDGLDELATPDAVLKPKQKVMEQVAQDLLTSEQCVATWKGMPLKTSAGWVRCKSIQNGNIS